MFRTSAFSTTAAQDQVGLEHMMLTSSKRGFGQTGMRAMFALAAFGFGAVGATVVGLNPESMVAERFASALETGSGQAPDGSVVQVAGTEEFWLKAGGRTSAAIEPAAFSHAPQPMLTFAVGDQVTVTREGAQRAFKVVAVSAPFKDGSSLAVRVTAEDMADDKAQPVVFTVPAAPKPEAAKPRAS